MSRRVVAVGLAAVLIGLVLPGERGTAQDRLGGPGSGIDKVVVVVEQDHTFDSYFGRYPGAEGLAHATPPLLPNGSGGRAAFADYDEDVAAQLRPHTGSSPLDNSGATARAARAVPSWTRCSSPSSGPGTNQTPPSCCTPRGRPRRCGRWHGRASSSTTTSRRSSAARSTNMLSMLTGRTLPLDDGDRQTLKALAGWSDDTVFDRLAERDRSWRYYVGALDRIDPDEGDRRRLRDLEGDRARRAVPRADPEHATVLDRACAPCRAGGTGRLLPGRGAGSAARRLLREPVADRLPGLERRVRAVPPAQRRERTDQESRLAPPGRVRRLGRLGRLLRPRPAAEGRRVPRPDDPALADGPPRGGGQQPPRPPLHPELHRPTLRVVAARRPSASGGRPRRGVPVAGRFDAAGVHDATARSVTGGHTGGRTRSP